MLLSCLLFSLTQALGECVHDSVVKKLEVFHRKQLRRILARGVRWPFNEADLYEKSSAKPL